MHTLEVKQSLLENRNKDWKIRGHKLESIERRQETLKNGCEQLRLKSESAKENLRNLDFEVRVIE